MNFKYVLFFIIVLSTSTGYAQRSGQKGYKDKMKESVENMSVELQLDELQRYSFEKILSGSMEKRMTLQQSGLTREEMKEEMMDISKIENEEVLKILDEDQYNEFIALKKEMRRKMRENNQGGGKRKY